MPRRRGGKRRAREERTRGTRKRSAPFPGAGGPGAARALGAGMDGLLALLGEAPPAPRDGIALLLSGIAAVELSLARLIHVECEKSERLARKVDTPLSPQELIDFEKALAAVMAELVKKEELLLAKLRVVLSHLSALEWDDALLDDKCDDEGDRAELCDDGDLDELLDDP